jgi:hypothetical protein
LHLSTASNSGVGRLVVASDKKPNGVKVFSATTVGDRDQLGEKITSWLLSNPHRVPLDAFVTQSSDESFHCIAITIFFYEEPS